MANDDASRQILDIHVRRYEEAARSIGGKRVLDIACGSGYGSQMLGRAGAQQVVAVDLSAAAIAYAQSHYAAAGVQFICANAEEFEWPERFDMAVSFETVEHLHEPARFLDRVHRLLVPGGTFQMSVPLGETRDIDPFHFHKFDADQVFALLKGAGFTVETSRLDYWGLRRRDVLRWLKLYPTAAPTFREAFLTGRGWRMIRDFIFRGGFPMPMFFVAARRDEDKKVS
ncbi:MAG: class I SAM-dependent methyltransferase [Planctomycetes bacterium]|nr:class I SAM-dependent methyltransferase [Planctomycetota bacterium]